MAVSNHSTFLRRVLLADAAISGSAGLALLLAAPVLADALGLPRALLTVVGLSLLPFSGFLLVIARREASVATVGPVIAANFGWVVGSVLLLLSGWVAPTTAGYAFVVVQAVAVAALGEMELFGLRRAAAVPQVTSA